MRLLLDETHSPVVAAALREAGWDVIAVLSEPSLRGLSGAELLEHARVSGRAVVTENVGDFLSLAAGWSGESKEHCGLILTSPKRFNRATMAYPSNLIAALGALLESPPADEHSWTWWL